ncbi:hypothetical protein MJM45_32710, partial [Salmonella enterica subsp. enterica serovar Kentucky]|nr:hypothetical protein [Salmonella enterica subsp. enterica serovar Kentucky]
LYVSRQRGRFRHWSLLLAILTLILSLLGTLIVRSGILVSVHASDIHDKLTEKDTSSDDKKNADEQTRNNINRLDDSINNLTRG